LDCLFEVSLCFVVLLPLPAHFSEFVSGIRIIGVRSQFFLGAGLLLRKSANKSSERVSSRT
jgi:hypothetical protein